MKKRILQNFVFNAIYSFMNAVFPMITIPYLSRILMAEGLGKVNYARNIVSWFILLASLGIPRYGVKAVARVRNDRKELSKNFTELFVINFISTCCMVLLFYTSVFRLAFFKKRYIELSLAGIQLVLNIFNVDWFYQGLEEYKYITKRSLVVKVLSVAAMFLFVRDVQDYTTYALIQSIAVAGNYIFNYIHLHRYIKLDFHNLELSRHIKPIFLLLSTVLATTIYSQLDVTILGFYCSDAVIGYYSNCHKLILTVTSITTSLGSVMLPQLVFYYAENQIEMIKKMSETALKIILTACIPIVAGLILVSSRTVLVLFGEEFVSCGMTLKIFAPFILITTIGNLYGTQLLMTFNEEKKLLASVVAGAVINLGLNLLLVRAYAENGVTFASVFTEGTVMILQGIFVKKYFTLKVNRRFWSTVLWPTVAMITAVCLVFHYIPETLPGLIAAIAVGGIVYVGTGLALRNESLIFLLGFLRRKANA